jgi:hypothetical protein
MKPTLKNDVSILKISFICLVFFANSSHSQWTFNNDGSRQFDMRKNERATVKVTIESVDPRRVKDACDKKSVALGNGGFKEEMLACTFWSGSKCHIIVAHRVDMRTIGHEVMHCFQGSWHKQPSK